MIETVLRQLAREFLLYLARKVGEPLVKASVPKDLRKSMPGIYKELDKRMVGLLAEASPVVMTSTIGNLIAMETGREAELSDIRAVVREYSPVLAALRNISGLYQRDQQQP